MATPNTSCTFYTFSCPLNNLAQEIYQHITDFLNPYDFETLAAASKYNEAAANSKRYYRRRLAQETKSVMKRLLRNPYRLLYELEKKVWRVRVFLPTEDAYLENYRQHVRTRATDVYVDEPIMLPAAEMGRRGWLRRDNDFHIMGRREDLRQRMSAMYSETGRVELILLEHLFPRNLYELEEEEEMDPDDEFYVTDRIIEPSELGVGLGLGFGFGFGFKFGLRLRVGFQT